MFGMTIWYLRTHKGFFAQQLSVVPMHPPVGEPDGVEQDPQASRILSLLFQKPTSAKNALTIFEEAMNVPAPGQGLMCVLELLESLAFQWTDAKSIEPVELKLFTDLNFDSCLRPDLTGCYLVDVDALVAPLMQQK
ncbi:hypothetical protein FRC11_005950 [Ceratobasidium sp. 423]|nr:hypothetical protein FRC11_005950 [Ceratobasidium sp. 423]